MNPRRLRLRNLRTFADLDLELPEGRIAILGQNGAGKSTLATAVDWALFGPDGRSFASYLTQGVESTEMLLEMNFEHGGLEYRVKRTYSSRGNGKTTLDLFVADSGPDFWTPLTRETVRETQAFLETLLGLTRQTFRASAMLAQGDGAAFTEALPRDRKAVLAAILGLERWDGYLADARAQIRIGESAVEALTRMIGSAEEELAERPALEAALVDWKAQLEAATRAGAKAAADLKTAEEFIRAQTANAATRAAAEARVAQAERALQPLDDRLIAAVEAAGARQTVAEEIDSLMTPAQIELATAGSGHARAALQEHSLAALKATAANAERERQLEHARQLSERATALVRQADDKLTMAAAHRDPESPTGAETCPHCGQPLITPAAREHAANILEAEAAQLQAQIRALGEEQAQLTVGEIQPIPEGQDVLEERLAIAERHAAAANEAIRQRARLEERIAGLDRTIAKRPGDDEAKQAERAAQEARDALAELPKAADPAQLEGARRAAQAAEQARDAERLRWQAATAESARLEERLRRIAETAAKTADAVAERDQAHASLDELKVLERAYGRDGIPAWIVSQIAIPQIETEACRILAELGTSYRAELRTERATGAGEIVDALDVIITTPDGERPYETFSGGERTRINLALRIALARLLARRRSGESRLLVIDEPEFLDDAGTAALVQVLRGLDDFDRIWLISHVQNLRDAALDGTLEVTRGDDGWSRVTDGR